MIPFEFIITGSPVSLQTNNRAKLQEWKAKVREVVAQALPMGMQATSELVQVIITHYCVTQISDLETSLNRL